MAERSIVVRLRAEVAGYKAAMDQAAASTKAVGTEAARAQTGLGRMVQSAQNNRAAWTTAGASLTAYGVAAVGSLTYATNAAMKWESAWTGVTKTVDGSTDQMAALEQQLRDLATTLPATHEEIAAVAEAAGQLGVKRESIVAFTKTMVDLSETTNLSADEAATSIAQLMNVMQTAPEDVDNLGAALVALGNDGASTERDIIQMAQRIAGAGKIVGLTEGEVMGLANALASTGIEVEAGGSAVSKIMIDISKAVSEGGADLEMWARVAGMSAKDFAAAWRGDPAMAMADFVEGMGRMNAAGGDVFGTLDALGQSDVRVTRALLSMANAGDLLRNSLALGNSAWEDNTALLIEAEKRYDTTEAKLQIAKNSLQDAAITVGEQLLPALAGLAEGVAAVAQWFGDLPAPIQGAATAMTGITGVTALLAGGFLLIVPRVLDVVLAMRKLNSEGSRIPGVMGGIGKAAGGIGIATAAFAGLTAVVEGLSDSNDDLALSAATATEALLGMSSAADLSSAFDGIGAGADRVRDLEDAFRRVASPSNLDRLQDFGGSVRGIFGGGRTARSETLDQIKALGEGLATIVQSGNAEMAAEKFAMLDEAWISAGGSADELIGLMPAYRDALAAAANEETLAADGAGAVADGLSEIDPAAQAASDAVVAWRETVSEAFAAFVDPSGAFQAAIDKNREWAEATAQATSDSEDSWETYYDGVTVSAADYIAQLQAQVDAQRAWSDNLVSLSERAQTGMTGKMREAARGMIDELMALGPAGAEQVALLASMSDDELAQVVTLYQQKGAEAAAALVTSVENTRAPEMDLIIDTVGAEAAANHFFNTQNGRRITFTVGASGQVNYKVSGTGLSFFDEGGWTGPGSKYQPAGIVHADEHVIRASSRRSIEAMAPGYLDNLNRWGAGALHGYADGGRVMADRYAMPAWPSAAPRGSGDAAGGVNVTVGQIVAADPNAAYTALGHHMRFGFAGVGS